MLTEKFIKNMFGLWAAIGIIMCILYLLTLQLWPAFVCLIGFVVSAAVYLKLEDDMYV